MNVAYVAKHGNHDNRDEDAIGWCLERLGCNLHRYPLGSNGGVRYADDLNKAFESDFGGPPDLLLIHKWDDLAAYAATNAKAKAFWNFDLVTSRSDGELAKRSVVRFKWMAEAMAASTVGFCTDGDFVAQYPDKLVHLLQGVDQREAENPIWLPDEKKDIDILFTGSTIHGGIRQSFVKEMEERWGKRFVAFGHHPKDRVHGRHLAALIARTKVVVAPDGPVTDRYWSNRIYLTLGFGAFLIHPFCEILSHHYTGGLEVAYYASRNVLHSQIRYALQPENAFFRRQTAEAGWRRTLRDHKYVDRVAILLDEVRKRTSK